MFTNNHVIINKEDMTMSERLIYSKSWIRHKINVTVFVPVPGIMEKEEAPAMGDSPMERDENIMKFAEEMWFPQYFRAIKRIIETYERSPMPLRYIKGQKIDIFPMVERVGMFSPISGRVAVDNDGLLDMTREGSGAQIFGHEIGHKIHTVKESNDLLPKMENYFSLNRILAMELFAELTGEIIANDNSAIKISFIDENTKRFFKRQLLKLAWE